LLISAETVVLETSYVGDKPAEAGLSTARSAER
jgi:hypothetical protein